MTYHSAVDCMYEPQKLSQQSTDRLGEAFVKIDRLLRDGVSRLLLVRALSQADLMTKEEQKQFLQDSGLKSVKAQLKSSVTMKQFYQLLESKVEPDHSNELSVIDNFMIAFEKEGTEQFDR